MQVMIDSSHARALSNWQHAFAALSHLEDLHVLVTKGEHTEGRGSSNSSSGSSSESCGDCSTVGQTVAGAIASCTGLRRLRLVFADQPGNVVADQLPTLAPLVALQRLELSMQCAEHGSAGAAGSVLGQRGSALAALLCHLPHLEQLKVEECFACKADGCPTNAAAERAAAEKACQGFNALCWALSQHSTRLRQLHLQCSAVHAGYAPVITTTLSKLQLLESFQLRAMPCSSYGMLEDVKAAAAVALAQLPLLHQFEVE